MSQALAAVGSITPSPSVESARPVVFINGTPEPALSVTRFSNALPLDTRSATLQASPTDGGRQMNELLGSDITLAIPHALCDGEVRWQTLLAGSLTDNSDDLAVGKDIDALVVQDRLAAILDEPADTLDPWPNAGLGLGVFLQRLGTLIQAQVVFACDPALLDEQIQTSSPRTVSIGRLLIGALSDTGLRLEQSLSFEHGSASRTLTLIPQRAGRLIRLPWPDDTGRGGAVRSIDAGRASRPPRAWAAQGDPPVVEDTFELVQAWDPGLQGQPDSDYGRLTSSDFSRFGSVYRTWALNEDGVFSDTPFNQGDAFDVGELFDQPGTIATALRFSSCLTMNASGRSITPVIESSTDSGASRSAYPGQAQTMPDRAGVLLTDDDLPAAILTAAKAGTLRLRVTASLTSSDPIEDRRWDGNPFAGAAPTRVLRFGDRFRWRRVAPTSIHAPLIAAGTLTADTADDRSALSTALQQQIAQHTSDDAQVKAELAGAWTAIRPGDRVRDVLAPGVAIDGSPSNFETRLARVRDVRISFGVSNQTPRTQLVLD